MPPVLLSTRRLFLLALCAISLSASASGYDPHAAIAASQGSLPLILTVPHDGSEPLGSVPIRTSGVTGRDPGTRSLAERVAVLLQERTGKRPYVVIANFSRKYLDANRAKHLAMESPDAMPAYRAYHGQIAAYVSEVINRFPQGGLLVDVHGQAKEPETTILGTRNGETVRALLARVGPTARVGEKSILGVLAAKGYGVHPPIGAFHQREDERFNGGHTVYHYGSNNPSGIDAMQLEFGRQHRANSQLAIDLTDALVVFMEHVGLLMRESSPGLGQNLQ